MDDIKEIKIDSKIIPVRISQEEGIDKIGVEIIDDKKPSNVKLEIRSKNNVLDIKIKLIEDGQKNKKKKNFFSKIANAFSDTEITSYTKDSSIKIINNNIIIVEENNEKIEIDDCTALLSIKIPRKSKIDKITLEAITGDISVKNIQNVEKMLINSVSSDIEIFNVNSKMKLATVSGSISILDNSKVEGIIISTSGNILLDDILIINDLQLSTVSGNVTIANVKDGKYLNINSISGNVKIY